MRTKFVSLSKRRTAAALAGGVVLAVIGGTVGYAAVNKTVTLSVDGEASQVSTLGATVGDVLESQGIRLGQHDVVAPSADADVNEGTRIAVRYGRPLDLSVDGDDSTYWVTARDVDAALDQLGMRFAGAELSASRGANIGREGLDLEVVTPKNLSVKVGADKATREQVAAVTVADALKELDVAVDKDDELNLREAASVEDGDKILVTKVHRAERTVSKNIDFATIDRANSEMYEGRSRTIRSGRDGLRSVTYQLRFENGDRVVRRVIGSNVTRQPVSAIVAYGTAERPAPAPAPAPAPTSNYASGGTVWDSLAQCESGGNWAINTGNGYYGGLQFNLSTWQAYGGTGYPHENSRETQIAVAERLLAANGGYGAWPSCSSSLGLPQ